MVFPARKTKFTELGLELQCTQCKEYYPAEAEFFFRTKKNRWGLTSRCKACYQNYPSVIARRQAVREKWAMA